MPSFSLKSITLRQLVLLLAIGSAAISLLNVFYATYHTQQNVLINNTLETNQGYARKLADSTGYFLKGIQQRLAYTASVLGQRFEESAQLQSEADRLLLQEEGFNSVLVVDAGGTVRVASKEVERLKGSRLTSPGDLEALKERKPLISKPYLSAANNLVVFISQPIFDGKGQYLGYIGGTLYLQKHNALHSLVGKPNLQDGSALYVMDRDGYVLYHSDPSNIGTQQSNLITETARRQESGSLTLASASNDKEKEMLAGYAKVALSDWTVVAQRPAKAALANLDDLMLNMLLDTLPMALLGLAVFYYLARLISLPLSQLAQNASSMDAKDAPERIQQVSSWYFEATHLKSAILMGLALLNQKLNTLAHDSMTDPLTNLQNRRGMTTTLESWQSEHKAFSIILLDIDQIKEINDAYGHEAGDNVIKHLAQLMQESSRGHDVLCRIGGDEFAILLPRVDLEVAKRVAERLRVRVEVSEVNDLDDIQLTLSLGVASWEPTSGLNMEEILQKADQALYAAKHEGRNQVAAV